MNPSSAHKLTSASVFHRDAGTDDSSCQRGKQLQQHQHQHHHRRPHRESVLHRVLRESSSAASTTRRQQKRKRSLTDPSSACHDLDNHDTNADADADADEETLAVTNNHELVQRPEVVQSNRPQPQQHVASFGAPAPLLSLPQKSRPNALTRVVVPISNNSYSYSCFPRPLSSNDFGGGWKGLRKRRIRFFRACRETDGQAQQKLTSTGSLECDMLLVCFLLLLQLGREHRAWMQHQQTQLLQEENEQLRQKLDQTHSKYSALKLRFFRYRTTYPFEQHVQQRQPQPKQDPNKNTSENSSLDSLPVLATITNPSPSVSLLVPAPTVRFHGARRVDQELAPPRGLAVVRQDEDWQPQLPSPQMKGINSKDDSSRRDPHDISGTTSFSTVSQVDTSRQQVAQSLTTEPLAKHSSVQQLGDTLGDSTLVPKEPRTLGPNNPEAEFMDVVQQHFLSSPHITNNLGSLRFEHYASKNDIDETQNGIPPPSGSFQTAYRNRTRESRIPADAGTSRRPERRELPVGPRHCHDRVFALGSESVHGATQNEETDPLCMEKVSRSNLKQQAPHNRRHEIRDLPIERRDESRRLGKQPCAEHKEGLPFPSEHSLLNPAPQHQIRTKATLDVQDPIDEEDDHDRDSENRHRGGPLTLSKPNRVPPKRPPSKNELPYQQQDDTKRSETEVKPQELSISWVQHTHTYRSDLFDDDDRSMLAADPSQASTLGYSQVGGMQPRPENALSTLAYATGRRQPEVGVEMASAVDPSSILQRQPVGASAQTYSAVRSSNFLNSNAARQGNRSEGVLSKSLDSQMQIPHNGTSEYRRREGNDRIDKDQSLLQPLISSTANSTALWMTSRKSPSTKSTGGDASPMVVLEKNQPAVSLPCPSRSMANNSSFNRHGHIESAKVSKPAAIHNEHNEDSQTIVPPPVATQKQLWQGNRDAPDTNALSGQATLKRGLMVPSFPQNDEDSQTVLPPSTRRRDLSAATAFSPDGPVVSAIATSISGHTEQQHHQSTNPISLMSDSKKLPDINQSKKGTSRNQQHRREPLGLFTTNTTRENKIVPIPNHPRGLTTHMCHFITPSRLPETVLGNCEGEEIGRPETPHLKSNEISGSLQTAFSQARSKARRVTLGEGSVSPHNGGQHEVVEAVSTPTALARRGKPLLAIANDGGSRGARGGGWMSNKSARHFVAELKEQNQARQDDHGPQSSSIPRSDKGRNLARPATSLVGKEHRSTALKPEPSATLPEPSSSPSNAPPAATSPGGTSAFYRYTESVRSKFERQKLPPRNCSDCGLFFDTVMAQGNASSIFDRHELLCQSRHRSRHTPPSTPEDFWELSFVDEIEKRTRDVL